MIMFLAVAVLMTLLAVVAVVVPMLRDSSGAAPIAAMVSALAIPAAVVLMYAGISNYPWAGAGAAVVSPADAPAPVEMVDSVTIEALKESIEQKPEDVERWMNLGDAYLAEERFADARAAYLRALALSGGGDDSMRLSLAEASILADRNALLGDAGEIIDDVLSRDPMNPKALWYGGMAALGRGDPELAKARWLKLLDLSPPPQIRQIIEQQLANLGVNPQPAAGDASFRIPVRLTLKPGLEQQVADGAVLFLIARDPAGAGPPLAVVRREAPDLPMTLDISDADSMVPGRSMAGLGKIKLTARLANDGEALAASGDVFGEAIWQSVPAGQGVLEILLDRVTP